MQEDGSEPLDVQLQVLESVYTFAAGKLHTFKVQHWLQLVPAYGGACTLLHGACCALDVLLQCLPVRCLSACLPVCPSVRLSVCLLASFPSVCLGMPA